VITKTWETTSQDPRPSHEAQDGDTVPFDEPFANGQMYPGDPERGAAEAANCTCVMTISGSPETPEFKTVDDAAAYVGSRYGYGDFTGVKESDLEYLHLMIEALDSMSSDYPQLRSDPAWMFAGLGTYQSPAVPEVVLELGADAFAVTRNKYGKGPMIWFNTLEDRLFAEGTGLMGEIGFTAERSALDAMYHEIGHAVMSVSNPTRVERIFFAARDEIYGSYAKPMTMFMNDTGSIYAGGSSIEEAFATVFYRLNAPGGLDGLSKAAVKRLRRLADRVNEGVGQVVL
jgi:hypothetical protein